MTNYALLNNIDHADLKIAPGHGARFGEAVNQIAVLPNEFEAVQRDYPMLLMRDEDGALQTVALLGLDRGENLFVTDERWDARYIPALMARGPFLIGLGERDGVREPMIHIDLDHPRIVSDGGMGHPVFLPHGGNGPVLDAMIEVLRTIHEGHAVAAECYAAWEALDLIEPIALELALNDREIYALEDYLTISQARFADLTGDELGTLHARGFLAPALYLIASLGNISALIDRKVALLAAAEAE
ncbi:SapC family protein [Sphingomonas sp. FW199]|uniref:SapC family protein n=1 Tax=Sphingomonas sp. FW199 TaxID=3400217 RepID=UPI003CE9B416